MASARGHPSTQMRWRPKTALAQPRHDRGCKQHPRHVAPAYCAHPAPIKTEDDPRRCSQKGKRDSQKRPVSTQSSPFFVHERGKQLL